MTVGAPSRRRPRWTSARGPRRPRLAPLPDLQTADLLARVVPGTAGSGGDPLAAAVRRGAATRTREPRQDRRHRPHQGPELHVPPAAGGRVGPEEADSRGIGSAGCQGSRGAEDRVPRAQRL